MSSLGSCVYSSVIGTIKIDLTPAGDKRVSVAPKFKEIDIVSIGDVVYCEVLRIELKSVRTKIIATDSKVFDVYIEATLLKENSRSFDYEHINLNEMFRPSDIIKAKVIQSESVHSKHMFNILFWFTVNVKQVGKAASKNVVSISTSDNECGVICAESELSECLMIPKSWKEFQWIKTNSREKRKVAKPVP